MKDLEELLKTIYIEIRKLNSEPGPKAIPQSDNFFEFLSKKYSVIPYAIPNLIKMLVDAHMIFSFKIIEADREKQSRRVDGFVVAEGNLAKGLLEYYNDELIREYSHEFSIKYPVDKIIKEFFPKIEAFNGTDVGIAANIVINLMSIQSTLERSIMQYNPKWQEKQLRIDIEKSNDVSSFIDRPGTVQQKRSDGAGQIGDDKNRRITDTAKYDEFKKYMSRNTIEKTLTVYGAEFYSRVCFREYQFTLMQKLIEDDHFNEIDDLLMVKKMLQKTRANSDQDLKLQKYAHDINDLEKALNDKIRTVSEK
jgi:hypothetical protein